MNRRRKPSLIHDESTENRKVHKQQQMPDGEPWAHITLAQLESAAWRCLSLAARKVYERLLVEHMRHAGKDNGLLPCTYSDFENYGVRRKSIAGALDELIALGFVRRVRTGHLVPDSDSGAPSLYLITSLSERSGKGYLQPTYDWKGFATVQEAKNAVIKLKSKERPKRQARAKRMVGHIEVKTHMPITDENNDLGAQRALN
jgi:hypothetical protein